MKKNFFKTKEDEIRFSKQYLELAIEEIAEIIFLNLENEKKAKRIIQLLNARKSDIIEIKEDYIIDETTLNFDDIFENTEELDDQDWKYKRNQHIDNWILSIILNHEVVFVWPKIPKKYNFKPTNRKSRQIYSGEQDFIS